VVVHGVERLNGGYCNDGCFRDRWDERLPVPLRDVLAELETRLGREALAQGRI
jgi:hypothetical protein